MNDTPIQSRDFEVSVPGLYLVGPASANSLGPVARFAGGAGLTTKRRAGHPDAG
ncbi:MAG: hypothetical protein H7306_07090 [Bacteriovorax sp.]|nr:hypothetical protein [Rhizobacter sp.]